MPTYAVQFDFPEGSTVWAGRTGDGACGLAMHLSTADLFSDPDEALRLLRNGYGESINKWGHVVTVESRPR